MDGSAGAGGVQKTGGIGRLPRDIYGSIGLFLPSGHLQLNVDKTIHDVSTQQVHSLTVRYSRLKERGIRTLCTMITDVARYPHLTSFVFEQSVLKLVYPHELRGFGSKLAECFARQDRVRKLQFTTLKFKIGDYDLSDFMYPIVYAVLPTLQSLDISNLFICPRIDFMEALKDRAPNLEELSINTPSQEGPEVFFRLTTELVQRGTLRSLSLRIDRVVPEIVVMLEAFHHTPNLTDLSLHVSSWASLVHFAGPVFANGRLKRLKLGDDDLPELATFNDVLNQLSENRMLELETLDLRDVSLFRIGDWRFVAPPPNYLERFVALLRALRSLPRLKHVVFGLLDENMMAYLNRDDESKNWLKTLESLGTETMYSQAFIDNVFPAWGNRPGLSLYGHHFQSSRSGLIWPSWMKKRWV